MDAFLKNLADPASWINGLFFPALFLLIMYAIRNIWPVVRGGGVKVGRYVLLRRAKELRRIRSNEIFTDYVVGRANALFSLFVGVAIADLLLVFVLGILTGGKVPSFFVLAVALPVLYLEFAWLSKDSLVERLAVMEKRRRLSSFRRRPVAA